MQAGMERTSRTIGRFLVPRSIGFLMVFWIIDTQWSGTVLCPVALPATNIDNPCAADRLRGGIAFKADKILLINRCVAGTGLAESQSDPIRPSKAKERAVPVDLPHNLISTTSHACVGPTDWSAPKRLSK